MKKILLFASALAGLFLAGSCQRENLEPVQQGNTVTYTVNVPDALATKGIGDDVSNVNTLHYEVYRTAAANTVDFTGADRLLYHKTATVTNGTAKIELELVNDQNFTVLFWAQVEKDAFTSPYVVTDLTAVTINTPINANQVDYAAFSGVDFIQGTDALTDKTILLTRPVAQINLGTTKASLEAFDTDITISSSSMTVAGLSNTFYVAKQAASDAFTSTTVYNEQNVLADSLEVNGTKYVNAGMNYVGFASTVGTPVTVSYDINTTEGHIQNTIENVPVKPNYRTNIIGNLITSKTAYTIELDETWGDDGKSMEVIYEGLVKNINGDYEVATAKGLAYAINNLWAEGGNFYLTAAEYDMTGLNVTPAVIADGKTLNIYGETPVVTRAMTSIAGITIKGLDSIIKTIADGANVSISGVELVDEGSVLVETNNGTLVVSESTGEEAVVRKGNAPVEADNVKDLASLKSALASAVKTINITESFAAGEVVLVDRSVVINGNDKTFTTSATRAFRLTTTGIEVIFNDLKIVSEAVLVGDSIRGVSIDNVNNITLTLNDCSHNFTDPSANDWAYAVNVTGGTNHKVTINRGKYEGANVVNVNGANHTITIDGAVLTSLYQPSSAYYGFCVSLQEAENSKATIKNSTLNSVHAKAFGGTTKNEFVLENNTDNTQVYPFYIENNPYLTLNEAFAAAENNATIYAPFNAEIASSTVPEGKKVTLVLQNQATEYKTQLTGTDESTGSFALINVNPGADLTITGPGSIKLSATNNRGWNAYSSVVSNQRGTLTVNGDAVIEHLGGTDMAYGIDNLTNGKGTKATTIVDGATVKSTYRAIRQFLNGTEATNDLIVKAGSVVEGANKSIWMQEPNANANPGKLVVEEGAELYGNVYLTVTEGATEWPVSASIPASTLKDGSQVLTTNVPAGYEVMEIAGVWTIFTGFVVSTEEELISAFETLPEGETILLANDITLTGNWTPVGTSDVPFNSALDGNGKTISGLKVENTDYAAFIAYAGKDAVIKNLTLENVDIKSTKHAAGVVCQATEGVTLEYVTVSGTIEAPSYAGGLIHNVANAVIKNCVNSANISANRAGGIASWATVNAKIENVENNGNITGAVGAAGIAHGFAGSVKNATNNGVIISNNYEAAAGIVGVQKANSTYEYCYNYGDVTSTYDDPNSSAAGILGQSAGSASTLKYCANYGTVSAEQSYAAGIAYSLYGTINASYCYNAGTVSGADGAGAIAPKAQYGTADKASYCLNAGKITSSNGTVYQGSNQNVSSYYYDGTTLRNVADNAEIAEADALAVLNGGSDNDFFSTENGKITVK